MVSNTDKNRENMEDPWGMKLSKGNYRLIGWDIDTTGRRLIDEIFQTAAYTPDETFAQYIMPHGNLNPFAQRRYNMRVVTVTRFRMLRDLKINKFLKTKSEIAALNDFVAWLEDMKDESCDGIILIFHEVRKIAPSMLLEALKRCKLYDRFAAVVRGFCNIFTVAEEKCSKILKSFSLKVLSRVLLGQDEEMSNACDRARICYNILEYLEDKVRLDFEAENENWDVEVTIERPDPDTLLEEYTRSIESEERDLVDLKNYLERQNSFHPVFKHLMRFDWVSRQNASRLRRKLVENDLDFNKLKAAWENGGKKSIDNILNKMSAVNKREYSDLLHILDCFFDPKKKPVTAKIRRKPPQNRNKKQRKMNIRNSSSEVGFNSVSPSQVSIAGILKY